MSADQQVYFDASALVKLDALLRSLDAIHVAAVLELGDALEALVTYDARVAAAATALGVPVASPGL